MSTEPTFYRGRSAVGKRFLVYCLAILLRHLLRFGILRGACKAGRVFRFLGSFGIAGTRAGCVGATASDRVVGKLDSGFNLPLAGCFLSSARVGSVLGCGVWCGDRRDYYSPDDGDLHFFWGWHRFSVSSAGSECRAALFTFQMIPF